ncbi:ATP-dependent RNA helicase HrpB, partial [Enterobacter cloacae]|nr:ATP-dependent RNA helicase HrpB [Enterobacter cloacae]
LNPPPVVNLASARSLLTQLGALDGDRLTARGQQMAALGNDPRLAAMLVAAQGDDHLATAAQLGAILEEPPRGGSSDLGQAFSRNQGNWQQRAQQLCKRLNCRGGSPDGDKIASLLALAFPDRIARRRGLDGR